MNGILDQKREKLEKQIKENIERNAGKTKYRDFQLACCFHNNVVLDDPCGLIVPQSERLKMMQNITRFSLFSS